MRLSADVRSTRDICTIAFDASGHLRWCGTLPGPVPGSLLDLDDECDESEMLER